MLEAHVPYETPGTVASTLHCIVLQAVAIMEIHFIRRGRISVS